MSLHSSLGKLGEDIACRYLVRKGHTLLARNFRHGRTEIDIVTLFQQQIVFVEVKTRKNQAFGWGDESIGKKKISNICSAAEEFLLNRPEKECRYDIVLVNFEKGTKIEHIEDAFWPGVF